VHEASWHIKCIYKYTTISSEKQAHTTTSCVYDFLINRLGPFLQSLDQALGSILVGDLFGPRIRGLHYAPIATWVVLYGCAVLQPFVNLARLMPWRSANFLACGLIYRPATKCFKCKYLRVKPIWQAKNLATCSSVIDVFAKDFGVLNLAYVVHTIVA